MRSLVSRWQRWQIHAVRPVLSRFDAKAGRIAQDQLGKLGARVLRSRVDYAPAIGAAGSDGWEARSACWAVPREAPGEAAVGLGGVMLYLHGGGYVAGGLEYAKLFGGMLAARCAMPVFCLAYALAPERPYPAAMDDACRAYRWLLDQGYPPERMIVAGESAGGGMTLGLMHRLQAENLPLPAGLVCISPWTDLTLGGASIRYNARHDISLSLTQLEYYVACYAPHDTLHPEVSPALHSFEGFPPALVFAGADELLLDDARAVLRGYIRADRPCRLIIRKGMWHAWPLYPTPEAWEAVGLIDRYVRRWLEEAEHGTP